MRRYFLSVVVGFNASIAHLRGQNIEQIIRGDLLKASGGVSFNQIYYNVQGKQASRKPYTWMLVGNTNLQILGFIQAPFQFLYSNIGNSYSQPTFNQTSLHPSWKFIQTHFGTISSSYSPYTLNGHVFKGAALDINPGPFSFGICYGRFQKAIHPEGAVTNAFATVTYKRMGVGAKIGYNHRLLGNILGSYFYAIDDSNSITEPMISEITPQKNNAFSVQYEKSFGKNIRIKSELATSYLTTDIRNRHTSEKANFISDKILHGNLTTARYNAIKLQGFYTLKKGNLNAGYERIDPGYRTLGAYYFNSDLENITLGFSGTLWKNKLQISANGGMQHDNLDGKKLSNMRRFVGNSNLGYTASNNWSISASYSNFLSYTNLRPFTDYLNNNNPYQSLDTLNFRQISQNVTITSNLYFKNDTTVSTGLVFNGNWQKAADHQNGKVQNGNDFINMLLSWSYSRKKIGDLISISANYAKAQVGSLQIQSFSPVLSFSKSFFNKRFRFLLQASNSYSYANKSITGNVLNLRNTCQLTLHKVHNLGFSIVYLKRNDNPETSLYTHIPGFNETTITFSYSVSSTFFDLSARKKKI